MSPHKKWERLSTAPFFDCPFYTFSHDRYRLPDGSVGDYYYLDIAGASMVVPLTDEGKLVMVRQYRYLMQRSSVEFPAGGMRLPDRDPVANAHKELREEAGLEADIMEEIGAFAPYNGASNETCHVYLARGLRRVRPEPDPTEEMELLQLRPDDVARLIGRGEIWDGQTITSFYYFRMFRDRLPEAERF